MGYAQNSQTPLGFIVPASRIRTKQQAFFGALRQLSEKLPALRLLAYGIPTGLLL